MRGAALSKRPDLPAPRVVVVIVVVVEVVVGVLVPVVVSRRDSVITEPSEMNESEYRVIKRKIKNLKKIKK